MGFDFHTDWRRPGAYMASEGFDLAGWALAEYQHICEIVDCLATLQPPGERGRQRTAALAYRLVTAWTRASLIWAREDGVDLERLGVTEATLTAWYSDIIAQQLNEEDLPATCPPLGKSRLSRPSYWDERLADLEGKGLLDAWI